jgi:hypothetical protein
MAMMRITPMPVRVSCDWISGQPRAVQLGEERMPVTNVARVRNESAAYPAAVGPRTRFEVLTPSARLALTYEHRRRRWVVDGVDTEEPLPAVA